MLSVMCGTAVCSTAENYYNNLQCNVGELQCKIVAITVISCDLEKIAE